MHRLQNLIKIDIKHGLTYQTANDIINTQSINANKLIMPRARYIPIIHCHHLSHDHFHYRSLISFVLFILILVAFNGIFNLNLH